MRNPDKHIRKTISDLINNMVVNGVAIPCFDVRVTGPINPMHYVLMHSQTKVDNQISKCGGQWDCTILLDVVTRYTGTGNPGSRVLVNDIEDEIIQRMLDFSLADTFNIHLEDSRSLDSITNTENMFRQLIRYRIIINN